MGTNYYLYYDVCTHCNRKSVLHIGKCSCGWKFLFQAHANINSIEDYKKLMEQNNSFIVDEDDEVIGKQDFWKIVDEHQHDRSHIERCFTSNGFDFTYDDFS